MEGSGLTTRSPRPFQIPEPLKTMAESFSSHAAVADRQWLVLMGVALFVLPRVTGALDQQVANVDLPWDLGVVPSSVFFVVSTGILAVLTLSFCSAYAQMERAYSLAVEAAEATDSSRLDPYDPVEILEVLMVSSLFRVSPLVHLLRGKRRFFHHGPVSRPRVVTTGIFYLLLKAIGLVVYAVFPGVTLGFLWHGFEIREAASTEVIVRWLVRLIATVAVFGLISIAFSEIQFTVGQVRKKARRNVSAKTTIARHLESGSLTAEVSLKSAKEPSPVD